jgi:hypothetical protein
MFTPAIISLLAGMALGQRFKVLALVPSILLTAVFATGAWVARGGGEWDGPSAEPPQSRLWVCR